MFFPELSRFAQLLKEMGRTQTYEYRNSTDLSISNILLKSKTRRIVEYLTMIDIKVDDNAIRIPKIKRGQVDSNLRFFLLRSKEMGLEPVDRFCPCLCAVLYLEDGGAHFHATFQTDLMNLIPSL